MKYFFTADEHYGHARVLEYCKRPFSSVEEMDEEIIKRHNAVVSAADLVVHVGDFTLGKDAEPYIKRLNGKHIFIRGSHDRWLKDAPDIWAKQIDSQWVVACHYAMRVWPKSHYGSWQVFGHSHGGLPPLGKQHDVGVDNNDFTPVSMAQLKVIMAALPDNPNLVSGLRERATDEE